MKAVIKTATGQAYYFFEDGDNPEIAVVGGLKSDKVRAFDVTPDAFSLVDVSPPDELIGGGAQAWVDGAWSVVDQMEYDAAVQRQQVGLVIQIQESKRKLQEAIDQEADTRFYSDVTATFPVGEKAIQFRNIEDRLNLSNIIQGAQQMVMAGQGTDSVQYITADNVTQTLPAQDFVQIGLSVMQQKQAIKHAGRAKKDEVLAATEDATGLAYLESYDVTAGWPA